DECLNFLSIYGINLGIIFQIIDDILGTFGDEKVTGKPADGDIRENKLTALKLTALSNLGNSDKIQLIELLENPRMTHNDVQEVKDLFNKVDAVYSCKELAKRYFQEAKSSLDKLKPFINQSEVEFFESLLKFVMERKF
ncbi:MAG: polyprenyl synthetase family protein, partial [Candidatus Thorarchaeota archaeon]